MADRPWRPPATMGETAVRDAIEAVYRLAEENEKLRGAYSGSRTRRHAVVEQNQAMKARVEELEAQVLRLQAELRRRR